MEDFRTILYEKYRSTFKQYIDESTAKTTESAKKYFLKKYLPIIKEFGLNSKILDLGCGQGFLLQCLEDIGYSNLVGVDISKEQIDIAKRNGLDVHVDSAFHFLDNCSNYDLIFIFDFIEHFTKEEIFCLMDKIVMKLNDGGAIIIRTPNGNGINANKIIYGDLTHITIFNDSSLLQLLKLYNFNEIKFFETGPVPKNFKGTIGFILWQIEKLFFNIIRFIETGTIEKYLTKEFICKAVKGK